VVIRASLACELTTGHAAACVLNANTRSATLCAERHHLCCAVLVSPPRLLFFGFRLNISEFSLNLVNQH